MKIEKYLNYAVLAGIFALPFVVLVFSSSLFFPFIVGKNLVFRVIVEIIFGLWIILAARDKKYRPNFSPILISLLVFVAIMGLADLLAVNPYKAFWSNFERMEGFVTLAHLVAYFVVAVSVMKSKKIWERLFNTSIFASVIVSFYGFLQLAGKAPISQGGVRLDSTLGNAAYLAIYVLFHIFLCIYFIVQKDKNRNLKFIYGAVIVMEGFILYFTATRGAVIGFFAGLLLAAILIAWREKENKLVKKMAVGVVAGVVLLVSLFLILRNAQFVKNSPVLSRFSSISISETTTKSRFMVWQMALDGFKERPILGWGQEGFNYVFNKYYNPLMYGQEQWFDRTHNVVLDWLVAGGILGLASYLAFFFFVCWGLWKKDNGLSVSERSVLIGLAVAYFIHNLFVFDNIISYLLFFTIAGFSAAVGYPKSEQSGELSPSPVSAELPTWSGKDYAALGTACAVVIFSLYYFNVKPLLADLALVDALTYVQYDPARSLADFKNAISYHTTGTYEIREQLAFNSLKEVANSNAGQDLKKEFFNLATTELSNQMEETPFDTRYFYFMGSLLNSLSLYKDAGPYLEKALELSPGKQQIMFVLGQNYEALGERDKALEIFKKAFEEAPEYDAARNAYVAAAIYSGKNDVAEKILKERYGTELVADDRILKAYNDTKNYQKIIDIFQKKVSDNPEDLQSRVSLSASYLYAGQKGKSISELEKTISLFPSFKDQGELYIKQIEAGKDPSAQ